MSSDSENDEEDFTLIYKAGNFLKKDLQGLIQRFVTRYSKTEGTEGTIETKEHSLEDTLLHQEFVDEFEAMLEKYVETECPNLPKMEALQLFFEGARDTMEGRFMPLFEEEEDPQRDFVESLIAVQDFEFFFKMLSSQKSPEPEQDKNAGGKREESSGQKRK